MFLRDLQTDNIYLMVYCLDFDHKLNEPEATASSSDPDRLMLKKRPPLASKDYSLVSPRKVKITSLSTPRLLSPDSENSTEDNIPGFLDMAGYLSSENLEPNSTTRTPQLEGRS